MADEIIIETTTAEVIEVGVPGPQGPAGAAGTGLETLSVKGDTLYRGETTGERLPIGTAGQILKVSASGIPEWGAAPASGVSSVNGETGAVTLDAADVGALQSAVSIEDFVFDSFSKTLPSRRNVRWSVSFIVSGQTRTLSLPTSGQVGDRLHVSLTVPTGTTLNVVRPQPGAPLTIASVSGDARFVYAAQITQVVASTPIWQSLGELSASIGAIPTTSSSTGTIGDFSFSPTFMYVCIAPNTWRRVPIAAF